MIPHRRKPEADNIDSWLMSYADMITLLLAFFVIFVATSVPKEDKFAAVTKGMKERFGALTLETPFDSVYQAMTGLVVENHAERNLAVERTEAGMKVEIAALAFFTPGTAEFPPEQLPLLKSLADTLKKGALSGYRIDVEGYTSDEPPPKGSPFASNWELAGARATRIVRLLAGEGIEPARMRAVSFGPMKPLVPNTDAKGNPIPENRARNQRVLIRLEKEK